MIDLKKDNNKIECLSFAFTKQDYNSKLRHCFYLFYLILHHSDNFLRTIFVNQRFTCDLKMDNEPHVNMVEIRALTNARQVRES